MAAADDLHEPNETTGLLTPTSEASVERRKRAPTPLPMVQIWVVLMLQIVEPITSQSIYPYINQASNLSSYEPNCPHFVSACQRTRHYWRRRKTCRLLCRIDRALLQGTLVECSHILFLGIPFLRDGGYDGAPLESTFRFYRTKTGFVHRPHRNYAIHVSVWSFANFLGVGRQPLSHGPLERKHRCVNPIPQFSLCIYYLVMIRCYEKCHGGSNGLLESRGGIRVDASSLVIWCNNGVTLHRDAPGDTS